VLSGFGSCAFSAQTAANVAAKILICMVLMIKLEVGFKSSMIIENSWNSGCGRRYNNVKRVL
jgi:hypothetical protein